MDARKELRKKLVLIALPVILQQLVHYIQIMTDALLLGRVNPEYLASLGNVTTPFFTMLSFLFAVSAGTTVLVAHGHGGCRNRLAARISEVSVFFNTAVGLLFFVIWFFGGALILQGMGAGGDILHHGQEYIRILSVGLIWFGIELSLVSTLQGVGITGPILVSGIIKSGLNLVLDIILINGHLGFPVMGIKGAALATTIANLCSVLYLIGYVYWSRKPPFRLRFGGILRPRWRVYRHVVTIGVPAGLEFMLFNFGQLVIVRMLNTLDGMAVGVFNVVKGIQMAALFIYLGFARSTLTLVGQRLGARDPQGAHLVTMSALRISLAISLAVAAGILLFPREILSWFSPALSPFATEALGIPLGMPVFITRGLPLMCIIAATLFPQAVNVITGHAIRAMKDTRWMLYTQIGGTVFAIGAAVIGIFGLAGGLAFVFWIYFADESLRSVVNYLRFRFGRRFFIPGKSAPEVPVPVETP